MKFFLSILTFYLAVGGAQASTQFLCTGHHLGMSLVLKGSIQDISDINTAEAQVNIDGREVAEFVGADASINYIFLSVKAKNARGEKFEGRVTDLGSGRALITRLSVPGYGLELKNVVVTCGSLL